MGYKKIIGVDLTPEMIQKALELNKLFESLFANASSYVEILMLLTKSKSGMTRSELQLKTIKTYARILNSNY